jgi:hypothetical protein
MRTTSQSTMPSSTKLLACLPLLLAIHAPAQSPIPVITNIAPAPSARFPASWYPPDNDVTYTTAAETNAPYTATLVTTTRYLNPSTKQIKTFSKSTFQARDSAGRKRDELQIPRPDDHGGIIMVREVSISDPVSHCSFQWMEPWAAPGKPIATVTCMPRTLHYTSQSIWADAIVTKLTETHHGNTVDRSEPLGKQTMAGLEAVGMQHTRTQTDPQTGIVQKWVTEFWYSPDLKEVLQMKQVPNIDDPQPAAIPDFTLTDIHQTEPDAALFYPPGTYSIEPTHH